MQRSFAPPQSVVPAAPVLYGSPSFKLTHYPLCDYLDILWRWIIMPPLAAAFREGAVQ